MSTAAVIPVERVERRILVVRGQRVILDADLANLYGVSTKRLNEQVKRNRDRFPVDFIFRLTQREKKEVVANCDHLLSLRFTPGLPSVFTEHGAIMAANVLNSARAAAASVLVVRAFVRLRYLTETHREIVAKLHELELRVGGHDGAIQEIVTAIRRLMEPPRERRRKHIGFHEKR